MVGLAGTEAPALDCHGRGGHTGGDGEEGQEDILVTHVVGCVNSSGIVMLIEMCDVDRDV